MPQRPLLAPVRRLLAWLAVTALLAAGTTGCGSRQEGAVIDLSDLRPVAEPSDGLRNGDGSLRLAVAPVYSPRRTAALYAEMADYLAERLQRRVELVQGKTYAEINGLIQSGDVTFAIVCTNAYLQGAEDFGMEALVVPQIGGQTVYYSYLIVPAHSRAQGLADLRGKIFAFSDPLSNSGRLVPVYQLQRMGERPESFFSRYIFTYSHDNSIKAVANGLVDGAAVDSLVYEYMAAADPKLIRAVRVVARWGPFGINPVVVHPQLEPGLKSRLRRLLLTMHEDERGRAILKRLRIDRFVEPTGVDYSSVERMRRALREKKRQ